MKSTRTFIVGIVTALVLLVPAPVLGVLGSNTHWLDLEASSGQYASRADSAGHDITGALSISCVVQFESVADATIAPFVAKYDQSDNNQAYLFGIRDDGAPLGLHVRLSSAGNNNVTGLWNWSPSLATPYDVTMTFDPAASADNRVKVYIDGVDQGAADSGGTGWANSIYNSDASFRVGGAENVGDGGTLDGKIDDCRIWSRVLSSTEVGDLATDRCTFDDGASLASSYQFDNAYTDSSGNGLDLTGVNTPVFATDVPYACASAASPFEVYSRAFWW